MPVLALNKHRIGDHQEMLYVRKQCKVDNRGSKQHCYYQLLDRLKARNGITEQLKATDQMKWVRRMNAVRHEAAEIVAKELIYDEAT